MLRIEYSTRKFNKSKNRRKENRECGCVRVAPMCQWRFMREQLSNVMHARINEYLIRKNIHFCIEFDKTSLRWHLAHCANKQTDDGDAFRYRRAIGTVEECHIFYTQSYTSVLRRHTMALQPQIVKVAIYALENISVLDVMCLRMYNFHSWCAHRSLSPHRRRAMTLLWFMHANQNT